MNILVFNLSKSFMKRKVSQRVRQYFRVFIHIYDKVETLVCFNVLKRLVNSIFKNDNQISIGNLVDFLISSYFLLGR